MPITGARRLRFGVQLQPQRTTWPAYLDAVRGVEELGFDTLWNADHLLPFSGADDGSCFETLTTLAAIAALTSRVRIGTLVCGVLYRDPATLAKAMATVDAISGGRLEFGLGAAWAEREFRAYGLPFPLLGERLARTEEALAIVRSLWTQPRTTYEGRYYRVVDAPLEPKPVQRPHPPIMVGGHGRGALRLAARYADVWNGVGSAQDCAGWIAQLHANCREIARDPAEIELSTHPQLAIARSHAEAEQRAHAIAASHGKSIADDPWLLGTPAEIRAQVQGYVDAGVTHWIMAVGAPYDLEALRLFADEVMAAFR